MTAATQDEAEGPGASPTTDLGSASMDELRRLLAEERAGRAASAAREAALAEILTVINASPGDAQPVFQTILDKAVQLCGVAFASLYEYDGIQANLVVHRGMPADWVAYRIANPPTAKSTASLAQLLETKRPVHILDRKDTDDYRAGERAAVDLGGGRTLLLIPLLKGETVLGLFLFYRREVRAFTEEQISLLENFAAQAVIAMENARLITEQREALERQTATAEVLAVINASSSDLRPIFAAMLDKAMHLCDAAFGVMHTEDGENFRAVATQGVPPAYAAFLAKEPIVPSSPGGVIERLRGGLGTLHIADMKAEDAYRRGNSGRRATVDLGGARTVLMVALRTNDTLLGSITIYRQEVKPFSDSQIAVLQNFAAQAVIAIENARLLEELRQRTEALAQRNTEFGERIEQQSATIDVLKIMSTSPGDPQPVFDLIAQRAQELCNSTLSGVFEHDGTLVYMRATHGFLDDTLASYMAMFPMAPDPHSFTGRAILERQVIHLRNIDEDIEVFQSIRGTRVKSVLSLPLLREKTVIGAITIGSVQPGGYTDGQVALLQTFAEQAVIAITSAENYRALQQRTAELSRSVGELQALEETIRSVNASLDLDTVLHTIISRAVELSQADEGTIYQYDGDDGVFVPKTAVGMSAERITALRDRHIRIGETPLGRSAAQRAPLHVPNLAELADDGAARQLIVDGIHALLAVPLLREDKVIGGLVIRRRREGDFPPSIPTLLQTFAGQSVLAIENARLFQQLADRQEETRRARESAETALENLRRAQDRLVQSEKMASLGQLTAGIAHEIKNPLNFVNNFSDLSADLFDELREVLAPIEKDMEPKLRSEVEDLTATLKGNLAKIAEHGRRADSIVKNMLEHSRSGTSERREVDLNATAEEALNLAYHGARAEIPGFNITMEKDMATDAGRVQLYPQEFTRVLVNLINNGFYATRKRAERQEAGFDPTLRLSTRAVADRIEIRVRDNGTGIPAAVREKIFEPFFTTKPAGEGTGLGLSLSYDIVVKQHGGQLNVTSEPGQFTEFTITLPRRPATPL